MSERRLNLMDIRELILQIRAESRDRQIQRDTGIDRRTVKRYRKWADEQGFLTGPMPSQEALQVLVDQTLKEKEPPQNQSTVESYRAEITQWAKERVEVTAMWNRLKERGYPGSYSSVLRFVRVLAPVMPETVVRVERKPGEEAQVDFGYAGLMQDATSGEWRKTWAFVMVLAWSRHIYVEFVFDQKVETWLRCHRNALEFFGGIPERIVVDNLKAAITQAIWDDPQVQYAYRECAEHYGFRIAPCRPATPEHKGKVENGVGYVRGNFLGGRTPTNLLQVNREVLVWCNTTAGLRTHGTTKEKPLERFEQVEKGRLKPLPVTSYDIAIWKKVKLHRDCHIVLEGSYYSAPFRLVGQKLLVCAGSRQVRLFTEKYELVATHERAQKPGERHTHPNHLPAEKLPGLLLDRENCHEEAASIGPVTLQVVDGLLADLIVDRLTSAGRMVRLRKRFGDERLEAACQRALLFGDPTYKTVKGILSKGADLEPAPIPVELPPATTFARQPAEIVGALAEVETWN
jgi:transposase